jgi:hypothetical protein
MFFEQFDEVHLDQKGSAEPSFNFLSRSPLLSSYSSGSSVTSEVEHDFSRPLSTGLDESDVPFTGSPMSMSPLAAPCSPLLLSASDAPQAIELMDLLAMPQEEESKTSLKRPNTDEICITRSRRSAMRTKYSTEPNEATNSSCKKSATSKNQKPQVSIIAPVKVQTHTASESKAQRKKCAAPRASVLRREQRIAALERERALLQSRLTSYESAGSSLPRPCTKMFLSPSRTLTDLVNLYPVLTDVLDPLTFLQQQRVTVHMLDHEPTAAEYAAGVPDTAVSSDASNDETEQPIVDTLNALVSAFNSPSIQQSDELLRSLMQLEQAPTISPPVQPVDDLNAAVDGDAFTFEFMFKLLPPAVQSALRAQIRSMAMSALLQ